MSLVVNEELLRMEAETSLERFEGSTEEGCVPRRLRKAEAVLLQRTSQLVIVLERSCDPYNHMAILRTAESFGVQHVWIVEPVEMRKGRGDRKHLESCIERISRQSSHWLSVRRFPTPEACIDELKREEREIWVTDLSMEANSMDTIAGSDIPSRFALVFGRESDGVSRQMLLAADKRVYLPMFGFAESFNLSVSAALFLQRIFLLCPGARGKMTEEERQGLRRQWYAKLAKTEQQWQEYQSFLEQPPPPLEDLRRLEEHRTSWVQKKVKTRIRKLEQEFSNRMER